MATGREGQAIYDSITQTVYAEEDQVGDTERAHNDETFAWAAFEATTTFTVSCFVETTGDSVTDYDSYDASALQEAVDAATSGDTIKVAGTCAGVQNVSGYTQTIYIDKAITVQGGYTTADWLAQPDPDTYPTTLDAQGNERVVYVPDSMVSPWPISP